MNPTYKFKVHANLPAEKRKDYHEISTIFQYLNFDQAGEAPPDNEADSLMREELVISTTVFVFCKPSK